MGEWRIGYRMGMVLRFIAICVVGWFLASGVAGLAGIALYAVGVPLSEGMLATSLLSYVFYIAVVMWGFADRTSIWRPLAVVGLAVVAVMAAGALAPGVLET